MGNNGISPPYYTRWKIQPLVFIAENNLDFLRGNIIKYIMRYDAKNGLHDLEKARMYLERLTVLEKDKQNNSKESINHGENNGIYLHLRP